MTKRVEDLKVSSETVTRIERQLVVDELARDDEGAWDEFVLQCPNAQPFHLLGWRDVYQRTYGYRPRYLVAKEAGQIVGVMPLFEISSIIQGFHFTTLPGGLCTSHDFAGYALLERAKDLVRDRKAKFLAIRDSRQRWNMDLATDDSQCAVVVDISRGAEAIWKALKGDFRRLIRKAESSGLQSRVDIGQLDSFYEMFSAFTRGYGTPVHHRDLFIRAASVFPKDLWLLGISYQDRLIGGGLQFAIGETHFGMWGASLHEYLALNPNYLFYWEALKYAGDHGGKRLDMGRSRVGSGQHQFKLRWFGTDIPLYQQFYLHRTNELPLVRDDADQGGGRLLTRTWQRLPLPITRAIGPQIRRHIPFA